MYDKKAYKKFYDSNKERLREKSRKYYKENTPSILQRARDRHCPVKQKSRDLKKKYDISLDEYNTLLSSQDYCCAICKREHSVFKRSLAVDHNHETGKVRALLCQSCNAGLGYYELHKTKYIEYLKEYPQ